MKKRVLTFVIVTLLSVGAMFASRIYITCCGVPAQTVDEDFFPTPEDNLDYEADLDVIYCNSDCSGPETGN